MKIIRSEIFFVLSLLLLSLSLQGCIGKRRNVDLSSVTLVDEVAYAKAVNPFVLQRLGAVIPDESVLGYNRGEGIREGHVLLPGRGRYPGSPQARRHCACKHGSDN